MKPECVQLNLVLAWSWILLGFVSGMVLGLGFHRENWLGGYGSLRRRMYRLAHISFFGMGVVNLLFCFTVTVTGSNPLTTLASWGFIGATVLMPTCCLLMAHFSRMRLLFALPVMSAIAAGCITLSAVLRMNESGHDRPTLTLGTLQTSTSQPKNVNRP